jgi:hypothetical protein
VCDGSESDDGAHNKRGGLTPAPRSNSIHLCEAGRRFERIRGGGSTARGRLGREDVGAGLALLEPAATFPLPGLEEAGVSCVFLDDTLEEAVDALKVDRFEDPAVEAGLDVCVSLLLKQGSGDGEDGDAAIGVCARGEAGVSVAFLE